MSINISGNLYIYISNECMYNVAIQTFMSFTYRYLESPMLINLNKKLQRLHNNVIYQSLFHVFRHLLYNTVTDLLYGTSISILLDRILQWKLSNTDDRKWMPKKKYRLPCWQFSFKIPRRTPLMINMLVFLY